MRKASATISPLSCFTSSMVPATVPPVASRSSTTSTFAPGANASRCISSVADRDEARAERVRDGGAEDEAARFHADDHVDLARPDLRQQAVDGALEERPLLEERGDVLEEDAGFREVRDVADP